MMENKIKVYVISYCQNGYQKERVRNFVDGRGGEVVNTDFSKRTERGWNSGRLKFNIEEEKILMGSAEEAWIIMAKSLCHFLPQIRPLELVALRGGLVGKYFQLNQTGKYVGKGREVKRGELFGINLK